MLQNHVPSTDKPSDKDWQPDHKLQDVLLSQHSGTLEAAAASRHSRGQTPQMRLPDGSQMTQQILPVTQYSLLSTHAW